MPLAPIVRPVRAESNQPRRTGRILIVAVLVATLVGCAEGTSRDADQGRERDKQRTSVVDELQSTRTAQFVSGSPEATASPDE